MSTALRSAVETVVTVEPDLFDDYLGPAEVVHAGPTRVRVAVGDRRIEATLALPLPYEPAVDDLVLLFSKRGAAYVIGIITGKGKLPLVIAGDVEIRAQGGTLSLVGDEGVRIEGREVEVSAKDRLRVIASNVSELFGSLTRHVTGKVVSHADEIVSTVRGRRIDRARSSTTVAEETVTINGKRIHLG